MIVVASSNGKVGIVESVRVLREGGSAMDAVEAGIRLVEENGADHSVGYNGFPNILGRLQLDASIMNGRSLESGAVAAMENYVHAISVARKVMEHLPHVLLAGEGATRFASEMGFSPAPEMVTPEIMEVRRERLLKEMPAETFANLADRSDLWEWVKLATDPERTYSTVNFIAQDGHGDLCAGVSTSGWAWKYPGRVGDSPIIGAGNYADNRYGAAACTGMGEMAIRASTAHSLVFYMKMGMSVVDAGARAMADLNDLGGRFLGVMNLIALDKDGNHAGYTSMKGRTYTYMTPAMEEPVVAERRFVALSARWDST